MKRIYQIFIFLCFISQTKILAQSEIWGVTPSGGEGFGTIVGASTGSTGFSTIKNFSGAHGSSPQLTRLLQAGNGKMYGLNFSGGANGTGVLYEYDITSNTYTKKYDFNTANGTSPRGALIQASNGKLYGMTSTGGANNLGVIFEYDYSTSTYTKKVDLSQANGSQPFGSLVELSTTNGKLYGMTRSGGTNSVGTIFEYDLSSATYTKKIDLSTALGTIPQGDLVQSGSLLYGLCNAGGTNSVGTLIEYDYSSNVCTKKIDLSSTIGSGPTSSLFKASDGNMYGLTAAGGTAAVGVIFQYSISTNTWTKLYDLNATNGSIGNGKLVQASTGKLYGTTRIGGANSQGVIFEFDISTSTYTKKLDLQNTTIGGSSFTSPMIASNGKIYGPLTSGGLASGGVIYEYDLSTFTYTKKIDLNSAINGGVPNGGMVYASNGKLYGTTNSGGTSNLGVIFEYDKSTNTYTKKVDMTATLGSVPIGGMMEALNGKLYGMTNVGGTSGVGTLYEYDYGTNTYTKKVDFSSGTTGSNPFGHLIQATNGKLYGLTKNGGANGLGTIIEYNISTNTIAKVADFAGTSNGQLPSGSLIEAPNGKLYGMTQLGGVNSQGVVFEYDISSSTLTKKIDLSTTTGGQPFGSFVLANDGNLYALTRTNGANSLGTLVQYDYVNNILTNKVDLSSTTGNIPGNSLIKTASGKLYATLTAGGTNSLGTLVEYDVSTASLTKLIDLSSTSGYSATLTRMTEICPKPQIPAAISATSNICQGNAIIQNFSIAAIATATSYAWTLPLGVTVTTGANTNSLGLNLSGLNSGIYSYSVGGVNFCGTGSLSVSSITVNSNPTLSVNSGTICKGTSFTISPSGGVSYTISGGSSVVSPTTTTNYSVLGTNSLGCVSIASVVSNVLVNNLPSITSIPASTAICSGNNLILTGGGGITYNWTGGITDGTAFVPVSSGSYVVTGTDGNNCTNSAIATVTVNSLPIISVSNGTICSGSNFVISPTGASTYTFQGGTATVSPVSNASYSVSGTSTAGCVSAISATSNITVNPIPTISVNSGTICTGNSFTIIPTGASTYTIQGGTANVSPLITSNYTVSGTSTAGCVSASSATSNVVVNISPTIGVNNGTICSGNSFTIIPNGANTYSIQGGSNVVSPVSSSNYTVLGLGVNGCISVNTATSAILVNASPVVGVNSGTVCSGGSFTIVPNGASSYTISSGSPIVSPTTNTFYTVIGLSAQGCVSSNTAVSNVTVFSLPTISVNSGTICSGNSFTIIPNGASTYTIQGGTANVSPLITSNYTVSGTSTAGCVSASSATSNVVVNISPTIGVNNGTICSGNSFTIIPNGANTYSIQGGSNVVSPVSSSNYTVRGLGVNGCISVNTATSAILVNASPVVGANSGTVCSFGSFTIVPSGASTYTISSGSPIVSPTTNTFYTVIGLSAQGCVSSNTAVSNVTVFSLPTISVNSGTICSGNSFTIVPNGASTYTIQGGLPVVSPVITSNYTVSGTSTAGCVSASSATSNVVVNISPTIGVNNGTICSGNSFTIIPNGANTYSIQGGSNVVSPVSSSNYTVLGLGVNGCISVNTATSAILVNASPVVGANSGTVCSGGSFTIVPNGASSYTISSGSPIVSPTTNTFYTVIGLSAQGCVSSNTAVSNVTVFSLPTISVNSGTICSGNSFTIVPNGASTYTIQGGLPVVSPVITSNYTVSGTSSLGCVSTNTAIATVSVIALPTLFVNSGILCAGKIFTISPFLNPGGPGNFTVTGGSFTVNPTVNTNYTVSATNSLGCNAFNVAVSSVSINALPILNANSGTICSGMVFNPTVTGANTYTYSSPLPLMPLVNTTYSVIGSNAATGCISNPSSTFAVTVNTTPIIIVTGSSTMCVGSVQTLTASGASQYTWSSGTGATIVISPSINTNYSLVAIGASGCSATAVMGVSVIPLPTVMLTSGSICVGSSYTLTPSGAVSYSYLPNGPIVSPTVNTTYYVSGTDAFGCVSAAPATATIAVTNTINVSISGTSIICIGQNINLNANGATNYTWSTGSTQNNISTTPTGTATVSFSVFGVSGTCSNSASFSVDVKPLPTLIVSSISSSICKGESLVINVSGASTYTWAVVNQPTTQSIVVNPSSNTTYNVGGTDVFGCVNSASIAIVVNPCTSLDDANKELKLEIYPNPNQGNFKINSDNATMLFVFNSLGQLVSNIKLNQGINEIKLENAAKGIYSLRILKGGNFMNFKLIVE